MGKQSLIRRLNDLLDHVYCPKCGSFSDLDNPQSCSLCKGKGEVTHADSDYMALREPTPERRGVRTCEACQGRSVLSQEDAAAFVLGDMDEGGPP